MGYIKELIIPKDEGSSNNDLNCPFHKRGGCQAGGSGTSYKYTLTVLKINSQMVLFVHSQIISGIEYNIQKDAKMVDATIHIFTPRFQLFLYK